jgi:hypothetical protein
MAEEVLVDFGEKNAQLLDVQKFLIRFGYLSAALPLEDALGERTADALRKFHQFYGIGEGRQITNLTIQAKETPRCGLPDLLDGDPLQGCPWPEGQAVLIYEFGEETRDLAQGDGFEAVEEAIQMWNVELSALQIPLKLERQTNRGQVVHIRFDWNFVDRDLGLVGPPVAHADFPPACGVITGNRLPKPVHFDDTHTWTRDQVDNRFHITSVAMHEIGHILGLGHLPLRNRLMSPELPDNLVRTDLTKEDRDALQVLYRPQLLSAAGGDAGGLGSPDRSDPDPSGAPRLRVELEGADKAPSV